MEAKLRIRRFDPESDRGVYHQEYEVEVEPHFTVLDTLVKIREEVDPSLALRCACRSAICGSCAMRINGQARLACKTSLAKLAPQGEQVQVEPMGNQPVLKDLVVDMGPFWEKVRAVKPWLQPEGPKPEREYIVPNQAMLHLAEVMNCIMCGACVSDCTALEVDPNFLGPAALAKAYRFVADPRDGQKRERLESLSQYSGVWDCTHCFICVQVCPKGVAPMDRILATRNQAMEMGFNNNNGSRHHKAFEESVRHSGRLNELTLSPKSVGMNPLALLGLVPVGLRAILHGKLPPLLHKGIPDARERERVRSIFHKLEEGEKT